ncbi:MAG: hypothetical protein K8T89_26500, partial [Planctomycetes bacterium]|nr:hypothetical protein [Planctomycetota bacterium]
QEELLGRTIRCPDCGEAFVVASAPTLLAPLVPIVEEKVSVADKPVVSRTDAPPATYRTGSIADFLQVVPGEIAAPPTAAPPIKTPPSVSPEKPKEVAWSAQIEPPPIMPAPKEIVWSEQAAPPPPIEEKSLPPVTKPAPTAFKPLPPAPLTLRRPRKKSKRLLMLIILLFVVGGGLGVGGFYLRKYENAAPERLYSQAKKDYEAKNYAPARKLFEKFAKEHPDDPRATEARFFVELSAVRGSVYSLSVRSDPSGAEKQLQQFLAFADLPDIQPFVEPDKFRVDVWQTVLKLTEDLTAKAQETFNRDQPDAALPWLQQAESLGKSVERFHPDDVKREDVFTQMTDLRQKIEDAHSRLAFLEEIKFKLIDADDSAILAARSALETHGYSNDSAFTQLIDQAQSRLVGLAVYKRLDPPIAPTPGRGQGGTSMLFAPRLDPSAKSQAPSPPPGPATMFFALARGILYALDTVDGHVRWATRVGVDGDILPLHIPATDLHPELAIVVTNDGSKSSLTARLAQTGEAFWHQPLPSACLAQPILIGQRVFVPLRERPLTNGQMPRSDETGVILEIEITSGFQIGRISLGRPLGSALARRPGTGHLYCPAEAHGVYVFDVERIGTDGGRLDPLPLGMVATAHVAGSLRGEPVLTTVEGDAASYLILSLADGLQAMKLQAYPLTMPDKPPAITGDLPKPIPLNGWTTFPAFCDSERLAVVTDRGQFGLFGINQIGNFDAAIFVMPPTPSAVSEGREPIRGQVVYGDEEAIWYLANGAMHQIRIGFDAKNGLKLVPRGKAIPLGKPLHASQVDVATAATCVVTQTTASASCRATALDLRTGEIRWQRVLGLVAQSDPLRIGEGEGEAIVLLDQDGGLYRIEPKALSGHMDSEWLMGDSFLIAPPLPQIVGKNYLLPLSDGQSVCCVSATSAEKGQRLIVRQITPGSAIRTKSVVLPAPVAGTPTIAGKLLVVPLADGLLHRLNLEGTKPLDAGPTWRSSRGDAKSICHLSVLSDGEYLASDGARTLIRWRWPINQDDFSQQGALSIGERIAAPAVPISEGRMIVADVKGALTMWDTNRLKADLQPLRAWRPSEKGPIPLGTLTNGPFRDKERLIYAIDGRRIVAVSPEKETPLWVSPAIEGSGITGSPQRQGNRLWITDRDGAFFVLDGATGAVVGEMIRLPASTVPAAAAIPLNESMLLAPLSEGTVRLVPIPK